MVFDVGGTINITERVVVSKNIYIAGQSAPGDVGHTLIMFSEEAETLVLTSARVAVLL